MKCMGQTCPGEAALSGHWQRGQGNCAVKYAAHEGVIGAVGRAAADAKSRLHIS